MASSIISAVREYLAGCPLLSLSNAKNLHISWTDDKAESHGIIPDGDIILKKYIGGGGKRQYSFSLFIRKFSATDFQALQNAEFLENLGRWCDEKSRLKELPALPERLVPIRIEALNGMAFEPDKTGKTGLFSIQFNLYYNEYMKGR